MSVTFDDFVRDLLQDPYFLAKYEAYRAARDAGEEVGDEAEIAAMDVSDLEAKLVYTGALKASAISDALAGTADDKAAAEPEKPPRKPLTRRQKLAVASIAGAVACVVAMGFIYNTSWDQIITRRIAGIAATMAKVDADALADDVDVSLYKARESVREELDETVWTTDSLNYRLGPGKTYEKVGTLGMYDGVKRTGITYNGWSRIEIDGEEYYVLSDFLTTEVPLITAAGAKGDYQKYALSLLPSYGWDESEIVPLIKLWDRESHWNPNAHNKSSGAHGIPQALPASKMASEGSDYYTSGYTQIRWGLGYILNRYGSPSNAWAHSQRRGWY
ncbi:MAG: hypothetical protein IJH90_06160 [Mogibacterium sp.]|nr:hypothetical protein [Mogibacterium sp.]